MSAAKPLRKSSANIRPIVQAAFFVVVAVTATVSVLEERGVSIPLLKGVSLHGICPFGGVVSFYQLFTLGTLTKKVHESSVVLAVIGPFGTFQEWLAGLGRKIVGRKYNTLIPQKLDRILRFLRYGVLAWVLYMTAITGKLIFQDYDPYFALFNFWTGEVAVTGYVALGLVILLSLFIERPFCKYACPYGALLGIFNLFRIFGIRRNAPTCISCKACNRACPMNIDVMSSKAVKDHQCISCFECTSERACPVPATVEMVSLPAMTKDHEKEAQSAAAGGSK
jgi:polyferredoxin